MSKYHMLIGVSTPEQAANFEGEVIARGEGDTAYDMMKSAITTGWTFSDAADEAAAEMNSADASPDDHIKLIQELIDELEASDGEQKLGSRERVLFEYDNKTVLLSVVTHEGYEEAMNGTVNFRNTLSPRS